MVLNERLSHEEDVVWDFDVRDGAWAGGLCQQQAVPGLAERRNQEPGTWNQVGFQGGRTRKEEAGAGSGSFGNGDYCDDGWVCGGGAAAVHGAGLRGKADGQGSAGDAEGLGDPAGQGLQRLLRGRGSGSQGLGMPGGAA